MLKIPERLSEGGQCNSQKTKGQNNDVQNTTQKTKDWATQTPQKPEVNSQMNTLFILQYNIILLIQQNSEYKHN